jgi:DNA primase
VAAVAAGFEGTVAPLGTALTEEHLALLWEMNDSPILCFDGDAAGIKAAERVADMVLPLLVPGRTVRIVTLPEGLDPDDIVRQRGREAFAQLIETARPLSELIWAMETRGVVPETPEGRAALEARLRERANSIRDASVRRHYGQAFDERLAALFAPVNSRSFERRRPNRDGSGYEKRRGVTPRIVVSDTLRNSRLLRPGRVSYATPREAAIILSLINHPQLAESRLEALASLELTSPEARKLLAAIIDALTRRHDLSREGLAESLVAQGFAETLSRMTALLLRHGVWQSGAEIAQIDAETGLKHALALHYKAVQLNRELKAAELALGDDPSEETFERLRDIQNQITTVDGTEALIEGFGSLSGRATRSF